MKLRYDFDRQTIIFFWSEKTKEVMLYGTIQRMRSPFGVRAL